MSVGSPSAGNKRLSRWPDPWDHVTHGSDVCVARSGGAACEPLGRLKQTLKQSSHHPRTNNSNAPIPPSKASANASSHGRVSNDTSGKGDERPKFSGTQAAAVKATPSSSAQPAAEAAAGAVQAKTIAPADSPPKLTKVLALDCEMVGVGSDGVRSVLARVCLVNDKGEVVYDKFVKPIERITDYRTHVSGVRASDLNGSKAVGFYEAQKQVEEMIKGRILVGHALKNDMKALMLSHPRRMMRDTSTYFRFRGGKGRPRALRHLAKDILGRTIQEGKHSPDQDARAALDLYLSCRKEWERSLVMGPQERKEMQVKVKAELKRKRLEAGGGSQMAMGKSFFSEKTIEHDSESQVLFASTSVQVTKKARVRPEGYPRE
eukprot:jgi/Mesvir1/24056/Mv10785-RA.1